MSGRVPVLPRVGLVEACEDRRLLGASLELWPRQRELLAAIEQGPRVQVFALGRRASKTTLMALAGLWSCLLRPELLEALRPGERGWSVGIATNLKQARLLVRVAASVVERSPLLAELVESASEDEIRFVNGTGFAAFACTSRSSRGWPIFALLLDEFAHHLDGEGASAAEQVWQALVPSTAQFGELARVLVASTPWGSSGLFHDLWQRASSGELPAAVAHRAASADVNPTLDAGFLEQERAVLGEDGFAGEYLADFVGSGGAYLDAETIADAVEDRGELGPEQAAGWVAGLDPAFSSDPFGLALVGRSAEDPRRLLLGVARSWRPGRSRLGSFEERRAVEDALLEEVAAVCLAYGARVVTDQYAAPAVVDRLRRAGLSVRTVPMTAVSKSAAFGELRARLSMGQLELYEQPELLAELRRLRAKFSAGQASVVNPRVGGSHGDMAQALALAVLEQQFGGGVGRARLSRPSSPARLQAGSLGAVGGSGDAGRMAAIFGLDESQVFTGRRARRIG